MQQWLAVGAMLIVAVPSAAQSQRLGDVAAEIRLRTDGETVIDERVVSPSPSRRDPGSAGVARTRLAECRVVGGELLTVLRRSFVRDVFYDSDWRQEVRESSLSLTDCVERLDTVRWSGQGAAVWQQARAGASRYVELTQRMERSMATDTPDYGPVVGELEQTNAEIDRHLANLARAERMAARAVDSTPPTAADVDRVLIERCGVFAEGSTDFVYCTDSQRRAAARLRSRSRYTVNLDAAAFNAARNRCTELHPTNLVERDRCERSRMNVVPEQGGL